MAAMKNVLSPISDTIIIENAATNPFLNRVENESINCVSLVALKTKEKGKKGKRNDTKMLMNDIKEVTPPLNTHQKTQTGCRARALHVLRCCRE